MNINGRSYPCIGFIRAKPITGEPGRWLLSIWPPVDTGLLDIGDEAQVASWVEEEVDSQEVERIARVAPHLIPDISNEPRPERFGLTRRGEAKAEAPETENRPGPSPSTINVR
jgi:hypothetical protein